LLDQQLKIVGGVKYNDEERTFATDLQTGLVKSGIIKGAVPSLSKATQIDTIMTDPMTGSTDVADVSWVVPTGGFGTATFVPGVPAHSWQAVACAGSSIGHKGMLNASKVLSLAALELYQNPELVQAAHENYDKRKGTTVYRSRLPNDFKPKLDYRK
jgi:aminobenzoyl-glutamate utilization protein B